MLGVGLERRKELLFNCKFMLPINKRKGGTFLVLRSCFSLEEGMVLFILLLPCSYLVTLIRGFMKGSYLYSFSPLPFDLSVCLQSFLAILFVFVLNFSSLIFCWSRVS
jgi:hypothetical protein